MAWMPFSTLSLWMYLGWTFLTETLSSCVKKFTNKQWHFLLPTTAVQNLVPQRGAMSLMCRILNFCSFHPCFNLPSTLQSSSYQGWQRLWQWFNCLDVCYGFGTVLLLKRNQDASKTELKSENGENVMKHTIKHHDGYRNLFNCNMVPHESLMTTFDSLVDYSTSTFTVWASTKWIAISCFWRKMLGRLLLLLLWSMMHQLSRQFAMKPIMNINCYLNLVFGLQLIQRRIKTMLLYHSHQKINKNNWQNLCKLSKERRNLLDLWKTCHPMSPKCPDKKTRTETIKGKREQSRQQEVDCLSWVAVYFTEICKNKRFDLIAFTYKHGRTIVLPIRARRRMPH